MKGIGDLLRERRARSRVQMYEAEGENASQTVNRDFYGLYLGKEVRINHLPLILRYEKVMKAKLARKNSYLTVFLDGEGYAFAAWWVWRNSDGHYIGLTRFEISDKALNNGYDSMDMDEHLGFHHPHTPN